MPITPNDILEKEFKKELRGYNIDEVDDFLERVADVLAETIKERNLLRERVHALEEELMALRSEGQEIKKILLSAQKLIDELKTQAEREAEIIIEDARARSEKILEKARDEERRLKDQILELKRQRTMWASEFRSVLRKYLELLDGEPGLQEKKPLQNSEKNKVTSEAEVTGKRDLEEIMGDDEFHF